MFVFDQLRSKDIPIRVMTAFILCCMLLLTVNLWRLQVASGEDYRVRKENLFFLEERTADARLSGLVCTEMCMGERHTHTPCKCR